MIFLVPWIHFACIPYLAHLGKEQFVQIVKRQKISNLLLNPSLPVDLRSNLEFVIQVRDFGIQELSLSPDGGYEYFVELDREEVGWNVSASYPYEFKSYTWWFPIAGRVPYKGFFNYELAKKEEEYLKNLGLDTRIRPIGGYSTLGWFSDPIYSIQLQWSRPNLAGLVFHEMAHATFYIPNETQFNESYANFIENVGIDLFYKKMDPNNVEYKKEIQHRNKKKEILGLIKETARELDALYNSSHSLEEKKIQKKEIIEAFKLKVINKNYIPEKDKEKFLSKDWNNEDFIGILRYKSGEKYFQNLLEKSNYNFTEFHKLIQEYKYFSPEKKAEVME